MRRILPWIEERKVLRSTPSGYRSSLDMTTEKLPPRYQFLSELGSGGMGRVMLVRDSYLGERVALKLLHRSPSTSVELEQIKREFALLTEIHHQGIARAYDFGYMDDLPYFTCQYVSGVPFDSNSIRGEQRRFLRQARDLTEAVSYLHRCGILHLDIKPGNILVPADRSGRPILIDFGLCRNGLTEPPGLELRGSLPYMAPEYFLRRPIGPWTDIYALGVTLYRIITGHYPRDIPLEAAGGIVMQPCPALGGESAWHAVPRPPSEYCPALSADMDHVILRCLALDPESRFSSSAELSRALQMILGERERPVPASPAPQPVVQTVGRGKELEVLERFVDATGDAQRGADSSGAAPGGILLITAPAGMGQTLLFRELKVRAQTRGIHFYLETGYPGEAVSPGCLLSSLGAHLGRPARARWEAFLRRLRKPRESTHSESSEAELRLRRASEVARAAGQIREPLMLAVDGLQFFDEISIGLVSDLAHFLGARSPEDRPPLTIALGYREEGPSANLLADLTAFLLESRWALLLSPRPLSPEETLSLYRCWRGAILPSWRDLESEPNGLGLYQESGGVPARIVALASRAGTDPAKGLSDAETASRQEPGELDPEDRRLLLTLGLLRKPATTGDLARYLGTAKSRLRRRLLRLEDSGLVFELQRSVGSRSWLPGPFVESAVIQAKDSERRDIHRKVARELLRDSPAENDPRLIEAVHHCRRAGNRTLFLRHALPLARYLKATFQNRAALELLKDIRILLPPSRRKTQILVALEAAELQARLGAADDGIGILRRTLAETKVLESSWRDRILLRLAALYSRRGDFRQAESLFTEGLRGSRKGERGLERAEFLFFLNEHAAMKAFIGEFDRATELCEKGLALAKKRRDRRTRDVVLNLYATRANVHLRRFRYDAAIQDFETALEIAETIGSLTNRAVVLNNLGIVYAQCDRYQDAIRTFLEAEKTCLQLDEGPSLTFVYGNLLLLHAKTGDVSSWSRILSEVDRLEAGSRMSGRAANFDIGRREGFFLEHHRGLALLYRGKYSAARPHLESAIRLGKAMGDTFMTTFDEIYLAEAEIFDGEYARARKALEMLARLQGLEQARRMALSRLAFLLAIIEDREGHGAAVRDHGKIELERRVPFLDAWDDLFLGWSLSIAGSYEDGLERLERAAKYFRANRLRPGFSLATWVQAESRFLRGEIEPAREILGSLESNTELLAVLKPLLAARLLIEGTMGAKERTRCAELLAQAGVARLGNRLAEWSLRIDTISERLHPRTQRKEGSGKTWPEERRRELSSEIPRNGRGRYLESRYWKVWTETPCRGSKVETPAPSADVSASLPAPPIPGSGLHPLSETVALTPREDRARETLIVCRSPAMRRLVETLDRLHDTELPVVITGETGTGKEMVARRIHGESPRSMAPFRVLDCATIPEGLLEMELFGARAGAFTDLNADRPGLLVDVAGGTVLIDEIAGASLDVQGKLLRVLSEKYVRPLGSEEEIPIDVRFLFSSSRDLGDEVREGRFREELLHRVQVVSVRVPPLRRRAEDVQELVDLFLREGEGNAPEVDRRIYDRLRELPWPGNVRQLRNIVLRLRIEHPRCITLDGLERSLADSRISALLPGDLLESQSLGELKQSVEREYILYHLRRLDGDVTLLSRQMGVSVKHFYRRCQKLGVRVREERKRYRR